MINRKGCDRKWSWPNLRYYLGICLQGLRKAMKRLYQESQSPSQDLNPRPSEYEAGVLIPRPLSLVRFTWRILFTFEWGEMIMDGGHEHILNETVMACLKIPAFARSYDDIHENSESVCQVTWCSFLFLQNTMSLQVEASPVHRHPWYCAASLLDETKSKPGSSANILNENAHATWAEIHSCKLLNFKSSSSGLPMLVSDLPLMIIVISKRI
jgi:hypothetical protein